MTMAKDGLAKKARSIAIITFACELILSDMPTTWIMASISVNRSLFKISSGCNDAIPNTYTHQD